MHTKFFSGLFSLDWERHKNLRAFITSSGSSIKYNTITKNSEIIDLLWKDEGSQVSVFPNLFHKPSLYTQRVYSNTIGINEDSVCSSKTENIKRQEKANQKKRDKSYKQFFRSYLPCLQQKNICHITLVLMLWPRGRMLEIETERFVLCFNLLRKTALTTTTGSRFISADW